MSVGMSVQSYSSGNLFAKTDIHNIIVYCLKANPYF